MSRHKRNFSAAHTLLSPARFASLAVAVTLVATIVSLPGQSMALPPDAGRPIASFPAAERAAHLTQADGKGRTVRAHATVVWRHRHHAHRPSSDAQRSRTRRRHGHQAHRHRHVDRHAQREQGRGRHGGHAHRHRRPPPSPREWWLRRAGASAPPAGAQAAPCAHLRAHRATAATRARGPRRPASAHRARPAPPRHQHDRPLRPDDRASGPVVPGGPRPARPTYPTRHRPPRHRSREPPDLEVAPGQSQKGRAVAEYATDRPGRRGAAGSGRPQLAED